jgi:hypothetical protein
MINNYGNRNVSMILENMRRLMNEDDASSNSTEIDIKDAIPVMVKGEGKLNVVIEIRIPSLNSNGNFDTNEHPFIKSIDIYPSDEEWTKQTIINSEDYKSIEISYTCELTIYDAKKDNALKDKEIFKSLNFIYIDGGEDDMPNMDENKIDSIRMALGKNTSMQEDIIAMIRSKYNDFFINNFNDEMNIINQDINDDFRNRIKINNANVAKNIDKWEDIGTGEFSGEIEKAFRNKVKERAKEIYKNTPAAQIENEYNGLIKISGRMLIQKLFFDVQGRLDMIKYFKIVSYSIEQVSNKGENIITIDNENFNEASFVIYVCVDGKNVEEANIPYYVEISPELEHLQSYINKDALYDNYHQASNERCIDYALDDSGMIRDGNYLTSTSSGDHTYQGEYRFRDMDPWYD